ncbi:MAG: Gfo/Idh/MocA family oxidoreductase [Chitinophagaceae bacterium]|nr:Gfo/Idh/MocA family oxidoreductase [Chitinophagaceae bacterium]
MSSNRRQFLKLTGLTATGLAGSSLQGFSAGAEAIEHTDARKRKQRFNMCGYAAPKLDTVRIGYLGLGNRGAAAAVRITNIAGVEVKAICDNRPQRTQLVLDKIKGTKHQPVAYNSGDEAWKEVCERDDIDLIYICTPWYLHTPMAVYAMNHGKHVVVEVPAAQTLEECWQLVETSEKTKRHCMILENDCYSFFELLTLNMARQGFFGEIIHTEGAYIHDIARSLFDRERRPGSWRLNENAHRNGNLYPTHGLGPIAQIMNLNRGDRMDYLISMSSNDFTLNNIAKELAAKDPSYARYVDNPFRGNMNVTTIRTIKGKTIMLQHDISSPRVYSNIHLISGTKASAMGYPEPPRIAVGHEKWLSESEFKAVEDKYTLPIVKKIGELAKEIGGHGGIDFMMDWRTIDCLRNGLPLDIDVYDAALWSSIVPLSAQSVAKRSKAVDVPDFTGGSWEHTNKPVEISIEHGNLTGVVSKNSELSF